MKVLIGCEFSGRVREAFRRMGHDAWSCDILPSEIPGAHIQDDVFNHLEDGWDMLIHHWRCFNMCSSGARWFHKKLKDQAEDVAFFIRLCQCTIPLTCGENPIGVLSTKYRKPDQIIHPWQFGCGETKATCLWLKGLPPLKPTNIVDGRENKVWKMGPSPTRWKDRSRTYQGIADAMADQWGNL